MHNADVLRKKLGCRVDVVLNKKKATIISIKTWHLVLVTG